MTMKHNVPPPGSSDPIAPAIPTFDPVRRYRYTWPGQEPKIVSGEELTALTRGADLALLNIEEIGVKQGTEIPPPPALDVSHVPFESHVPPFRGDREPIKR